MHVAQQTFDSRVKMWRSFAKQRDAQEIRSRQTDATDLMRYLSALISIFLY